MIRDYIMIFLVVMALAAPLFIAARFIYFKITKNKVNIWHELLLLLFVTFCGGLAIHTVLPYGFSMRRVGFSLDNLNLIPFKTIIEMLGENFQVSYLNLVGNIIMFAPFGFFPPLLWGKGKFINSVWLTFNVSFCIEIVQLFLDDRATDIDDLILNTLGGIIGWCVYWLLKKIFPKFSEKFLS